jgi:hypothetical protein
MFRKNFKLLIILCYLLILNILIIDSIFKYPNNATKNIDLIKSGSETEYIILFWKGYYSIIGNTSKGLKCKLKNNYIFTNDEKIINRSSAVVFHWYDMLFGIWKKVKRIKYRYDGGFYTIFSDDYDLIPLWKTMKLFLLQFFYLQFHK